MLALGLLCCALVALTGAEFNPHIVGGSQASYGDHPYICSLQQKGRNSWGHICGAVIYNNDYVATAAHCVNGTSASVLRLRCGEHILNETDDEEITRSVSEVIPHESYGAGSGAFPNDIAVLKLTSSLSFTSKLNAIRFADSSDGDFANAACILSGWGRLSGWGSLPHILQKVSTKALSNSECSITYWKNNINSGHICVNEEDAGTGACNGDSGGPMRCNDVIVGLTSWGPFGCSTYLPSVYTRVSLFHDWLVSKTSTRS